MIVVTGATGKVGRPLVTALLAAAAEVRGLTRDPAAAGLPAGAEVARFDPGRPETIAAALAGAAKVFLNVAATGGCITELMAAAARAGVRSAVLLSSLTGPESLTQAEQARAIGAAIGRALRVEELPAAAFRQAAAAFR